KPVPGIAPAAKQMGAYAARVIRTRVEGASPPPPFRYRHEGSLATIGRNSAAADLRWMTLSGWPAWLVWSAAHIYFLIGFRSRIVVTLDWLWAYVTFRRGASIQRGLRRCFSARRGNADERTRAVDLRYDSCPLL